MKLILHNNYAGDWNSLLIMERSGRAFVRLYWYLDDMETIYLDYLSVTESYRNKKMGTYLLNYCENVAKEKEFRYIYLVVEKESWVQNWYIRKGFTYIKKDKDRRLIWLKKEINNEYTTYK